MASLFSGAPQTATSYVSSTTEYPKWMQDAIYNQIQVAQNLANAPYQPYSGPTVAELTPLQQQAYGTVSGAQGAWKPALTTAQTGMQGLTTQNALSAASPYLTEAAKKAPEGISSYMNPYQQNVLDVIAKQGGRNLTENLLPGVSDAFIKAGQFGSSRMGEMGSRALRDTQEAILAQQAQTAQTGYAQGLSASQSDLARQAQLAGTVGSISGADISQQQSTLQNLAALAQQQQGLTYADTAALEAAGTAQQSNQQKVFDAAKAQYAAAQAYPQSQMDWLSEQIRGLTPSVSTAATNSGATTGQTYSPSILSQLASGLSLYKGATS